MQGGGDKEEQLDLTDDAVLKTDNLVQTAKKTPGKVSLMDNSALHGNCSLIGHEVSKQRRCGY